MDDTWQPGSAAGEGFARRAGALLVGLAFLLLVPVAVGADRRRRRRQRAGETPS